MSTNSTKTIKGRISNKHGTEEYWVKSVYKSTDDLSDANMRESPFVPLPGELIIYDPDSINGTHRFKFGDPEDREGGARNVFDLPFVKEGLTDEQSALLDKLSDWYDEEHYVPMTGTFSMSPNTTTYEMGTSKDVTFSWTFSKLPIQVTFNSVAQTPATSGTNTVTVTSDTHATKTYTVYGKYKEGETVTKSLSINFRNRYYYGYVAIPETIDGEFIKSLANKNWATTKTISFTPNCTAGTYVWYAYPKRLGLAVMWMGGFQGGFEDPLTIPVTNSSGFTEDYYLYRSINSGIGNLGIQAK